MKKIMILLCLALGVHGSNAQTTGYVEGRAVISSTAVPAYHGWASVTNFPSDSSAFGVWSYSLVGPTWGELIAGGAMRFGSKYYLEIGAGAGYETGTTKARFAAYVYADLNKKHTILVNVEKGIADWYIAYWTYAHTQKIGFGLYGEAWVGVGPRVEFKPSSTLLLWAGGGYNVEGKTIGGIVCLRWVMN